MLQKLRFLFIAALVMAMSAVVMAQVTGDFGSLGTGNWGTDATNWRQWDGSGWNTVPSNVPTPSDNVWILSGHTVTIDVADASCNDLTISGYLYFAQTNGNGLTVNGNVIVNSAGRLKTSGSTPASGPLYQQLILNKDLTVNSSGQIDMRVGSGSNVSVGRVVFSGNSNSNIYLSLTTYSTSGEEFNSVVINKTGGAKVVLATGNLFQNNNASTAGDTLVFISGMIETTGSTRWVHLATSTAAVQGASMTCYVQGILGRGITNTAGNITSRTIDIGDATGYRPIVVSCSTALANSTGHYVWASVVDGDAAAVSNTYAGGIDLVSSARYYKVGYNAQNTAIPLWHKIAPSYLNDDGVTNGTTELQVAYRTSTGPNWIGIGPSSSPAATPGSSPTAIPSDSLDDASKFSITGGDSIYVSLARISGGTTSLPVEMTSFTASIQGANSAILRWSTAMEVNNMGFDVERRSVTGDELRVASWLKIGFVSGAGTSTSPREYSYQDVNLTPGVYVYRLKQIDNSGAYKYSTSTQVDIGVSKGFELLSNYPNPFNPETNIRFSVPENGFATLKVFNMLGQEVATLFSGIAQAGHYIPATFNAGKLASGVYFSRLEYNGKSIVQRMLMTK